MNNENLQNTTPTEEVKHEERKEINIDYDRINSHINSKVENEVGKFIKTFIENNKQNQPMTEEVVVENEKERELKEWRI